MNLTPFPPCIKIWIIWFSWITFTPDIKMYGVPKVKKKGHKTNGNDDTTNHNAKSVSRLLLWCLLPLQLTVNASSCLFSIFQYPDGPFFTIMVVFEHIWGACCLFDLFYYHFHNICKQIGCTFTLCRCCCCCGQMIRIRIKFDYPGCNLMPGGKEIISQFHTEKFKNLYRVPTPQILSGFGSVLSSVHQEDLNHVL